MRARARMHTPKRLGRFVYACRGSSPFKVKAASLLPSGSGSRGFGFAEFDDAEAAHEAMKKYDGAEALARRAENYIELSTATVGARTTVDSAKIKSTPLWSFNHESPLLDRFT